MMWALVFIGSCGGAFDFLDPTECWRYADETYATYAECYARTQSPPANGTFGCLQVRIDQSIPNVVRRVQEDS